MKTWEIPVTWELYSRVYITADTLEEAMEIAKDDEGVIPLPTDADYVDGSWRVTEEDVEIVRTLYNNNQKDDLEEKNYGKKKR